MNKGKNMEITELPADPAMLMSYINTKLRDNYPNLDALCDDMHINKEELTAALAKGGFEYTPDHNRFW